MYKETEETISLWADTTFGPTRSNLALAERAIKELRELELIVGDEKHFQGGGVRFRYEFCREAADIAIVLCRVAHNLGQAVFGELIFYARRGFLSAVYMGIPQQTIVLAGNMEHLRLMLERSDDTPAAGIQVLKILKLLNKMVNSLGEDFREHIDSKMVINRGRTWAKPDDKGCSQHIEPEDYVHVDEGGCVVAPDGTCMSEGPCPHTKAPGDVKSRRLVIVGSSDAKARLFAAIEALGVSWPEGMNVDLGITPIKMPSYEEIDAPDPYQENDE